MDLRGAVVDKRVIIAENCCSNLSLNPLSWPIILQHGRDFSGERLV